MTNQPTEEQLQAWEKLCEQLSFPVDTLLTFPLAINLVEEMPKLIAAYRELRDKATQCANYVLLNAGDGDWPYAEAEWIDNLDETQEGEK